MKVVRTFVIITSIAVLCCGLSAFAQTCNSPKKTVKEEVNCTQSQPVCQQSQQQPCPPPCPQQGVAGHQPDVCPQCQTFWQHRVYQPCPNCPPYQTRTGFIPQLRQSFQPTYQPYFGAQPLMSPRSPYAPHAVFAAANAGYYQAENAYPKGGTAFPGLRKILCPDQFIMSTTIPAQPIPTYTTRGPRDFFLNDNPSSIGY